MNAQSIIAHLDTYDKVCHTLAKVPEWLKMVWKA